MLPVPPMSPAQLAALALQVAAIASGGPVLDVAARIGASLVDPVASFGHERPTSSLLQSIGTHQTKIQVPGAEGLLVASEQHVRPHIEKACALVSPFAGHMREARPDLMAAVDWVCSFGDDGDALVRDRMARLDEWSGHVAALKSTDAELAAVQSPASKRLQGALASPALFSAAIRAIGWPDAGFVADRLLGFPTYGDYPDSGVFRAVERPATRSYCSLRSHEHTSFLIRKLRDKWRGASATERAAIREGTEKTYQEVQKLQKETGLGVADGPFTRLELDERLGQGCWHPLERFTIAQGVDEHGNPKYRPCDNARSSHTNECLQTHETIACEAASFPVLVASLFADMWPSASLPSLSHSTDDVELAYRRMAARDAGSTVVALYDTRVGDVRFFTMPGHNFGLASAVLSFNRHSQLISAIARRCFGVPTCSFFDDHDVCEPSHSRGTGKLVLRKLHEWLGVPLAEGLKDVPPRPVNTFLGVISDLSRFREGIAVLRSKPSRVASLVVAVESYLSSGELPSEELKHFLGKCEYVQTSATAGRVGRAALGMLRAGAKASSESSGRGSGESRGSLGELTVEALLFLLSVLPLLPPRVFSFRVQGPRKPPIVLYTDAMYETSSRRGAIGIALYDPTDTESPWRHASAQVPQRIYDAMRDREQYITQLETIAPVVAALSRPDQFRDREVICFIDNTGALFGLGKGDCRDVDCARMINVFHTLCAACNVSVWFEHVPSGANLADLPSRDDFELLHEMGSTSFSSELVWPDLTASMPDVFSDLWRRYSPGRQTNSRKRHAREVEDAIEAAREAPRKAPRRG